MKFSAFVSRLGILLVAFAFVAGIWASTAQAQTTKHPLTGNARFQIGNGLPIPIGLTPAPTGRVVAQPGAVATQTTGPDPKALIMKPGQLKAPGNKVVVGLFAANSALFQVATAIPLSAPGFTGQTLAAGGRTGPSTISFCPGQTATLPANPGCLSAGASPGINGLLRYTKTVAQFGGPAQGAVGGYADIAVRLSGTPPGVVQAIFAIANPQPTGAFGGPLGFQYYTSGAAPAPPNGQGTFNANPNGTLVGPPIAQHPTAYGYPNPAQGYGGPWTTGMLTVSVTQNVGPYPEIFVMSGMDSRVNGVGNISLVSGTVSNRGLSGPNGNRGWMNLTIGSPVSAMSVRGLAAAFGLLALAGGYLLHRRGRS